MGRKLLHNHIRFPAQIPLNPDWEKGVKRQI